MFIETLYSFITFLTNQGQARYFNPEEVFRAFNFVSSTFYGESLTLWEKDADVRAWLRPFRKPATINQETDKTFNFPDDYYRESSLWYLKDEKEVSIDVVKDGEWPGRVNNGVVGPDEDYPIANLSGENIIIRPTDITSIELAYFIKHKDVIFNYQELAGRNIVFDETDSVDTLWPQEAQTILVDRTLAYLGVPLKDGTMLQFKQLNQQK